MHHASDILLTLFIIFIAAQIGAEVAQRLKLPGVVGEIAAGCAIGPSLLGWLSPGDILAGTPVDVLGARFTYGSFFLLALLALVWYVLNRTAFGRHLYGKISG